MTSRADEAREEAELRAWRERERLFVDLVRYVFARAPRCSVAACNAFAFWRVSTPRAQSGFPRETLLCDTHRKEGAVCIAGSDVLRRLLALR